MELDKLPCTIAVAWYNKDKYRDFNQGRKTIISSGKVCNGVSTIEREKIYSPLVFVNNPVTSPEQDIIGFDVQVETLKKAIDDGATMVGLIADYGTGKSSMTELLCNDFVKKGHPTPIRINMWDSLEQASKGGDSVSVSNLTKSFLFQLANGKDSVLSRYVNKILSKIKDTT